jgi:DNA-binding NarL/FixJ family response regulator
MDIRMPNMDGLEVARHVLAQAPDCRVIMLTTFDLDSCVYAALAAGASGFLLKDVTPAHLAAAVRLVDTGDVAVLTPREREVLTAHGQRPVQHRTRAGTDAERSDSKDPCGPDRTRRSWRMRRPRLELAMIVPSLFIH